MAHKVTRLGHFSRLDTIMEATQREERQENDSSGCFHLELPQKSIVSSDKGDSIDGRNMQEMETLRQTEFDLSSTRIRNRSEQKEHERSALGNVSTAAAESLLRTKHAYQAQTSEMTEQNNRNTRHIEQVEVLFPEFFSSQANTYFFQQSDWYYNNNYHEKNLVLVNEKIIEDLFIRSWLNLFGECSYM